MQSIRSRVLIVRLASMFVGRVLPWVLICMAIAWFRDSAIALSQENANVSPLLQVLDSANRSRSFAFLLGILGVVYGFAQRELRRRAAEEFSRRLLDAGRGER